MVLPRNISDGMQKMFGQTNFMSPGADGGGGLALEFKRWWSGDASFRPIVDLAVTVYDRLLEVLLSVADQVLKTMGYEKGVFGSGDQPAPGTPGAPGGPSGPDQPSGPNEVKPEQDGKIDRSKFEEELKNNPELMQKVLNIAASEQETNPQGTQAIIESMMNRAQVYGTSLAQQARWTSEGGYYDAKGRARGERTASDPKNAAILTESLKKALAGSNISKYATDNASGSFGQGEIDRGEFILAQKIAGEIFSTPGSKGGAGIRAKYAAWRAALAGQAPSTLTGGDKDAPISEEDRSQTPESQRNVAGLPKQAGADVADLQKGFAERLKALVLAAKTATGETAVVTSGFRDYAHQARLFAQSDRSGKMVAAPGHSMHNRGLAADFMHMSKKLGDYFHAHAAEFGLNFPMGYEDWHIEPSGMRRGAAGAASRAGGQHAAMQGRQLGGERPRQVASAGGGRGGGEVPPVVVTINVNGVMNPKDVGDHVASVQQRVYASSFRNFQAIAT
jgi:hypothetical protein